MAEKKRAEGRERRREGERRTEKKTERERSVLAVYIPHTINQNNFTRKIIIRQNPVLMRKKLYAEQRKSLSPCVFEPQ